MNSLFHVIVRRLSTQSNHYKLVVIGAGCGGLACASKLAKKLSKNQIAIVDKNDVNINICLFLTCFMRLRTHFLDAHLSARLDTSRRGLENARGAGETSVSMHSREHHVDTVQCSANRTGEESRSSGQWKSGRPLPEVHWRRFLSVDHLWLLDCCCWNWDELRPNQRSCGCFGTSARTCR